jgi:hypothetical protein
MDRERRIQLEKLATEMGQLLDAWDNLWSDDREAIAQESPHFVASIIRIREILEHEYHFCSYCNETRECKETYCTRGVSAVCSECVPREAQGSVEEAPSTGLKAGVSAPVAKGKG